MVGLDVHTPTADMGSHQVNQDDSGLASPVASSGNATPQSAVIDTSLANLNGSYTSIRTSRTPVSFAMPALPSNGSSGQAKEGPTEAQRLLITQLSQFTQSVSEIASATIQHDQAHATIKHKEQEYSRWQTYSGDFSSLVEEQMKELKRRKATASQLDEKLKRFEEAKDGAVKAMVSSILTVGVGHTIPRPEDRSKEVKSLQDDVRELKADLKSLTALAKSSKKEYSRFKNDEDRWIRLEAEMEKLRKSVDGCATQSRHWNTLQADSSVLKKQLSSIENQVASWDGQITTREEPVAAQSLIALQVEIGNLSAQLETLVSTKLDIGDLQQKTNTLSIQQKLLGDEISREHETEPGLLQQSKLDKLQIVELRDNLSRLEKLLSSHSQVIVVQTAQIGTLQSLEEKVAKDLGSLTTVVQDALVEVKTGLEAQQAEQKKNDLRVGQDIERLDKALSALQKDTEEAKESLLNAVELVTSNHSKIEKQLAAQLTQRQDQAHVNVVHSAEWLRERNMAGLFTSNELISNAVNTPPKNLSEDYNGRLIACETVLGNLQSRFDNLSTADLAKNMVHQMQTIYPYPANVFQQLDQITRIQRTTSQQIAHISANVDNANRRLDAVAASTLSVSTASDTSAPGTSRPAENNSDTRLEEKLLTICKELEGKIGGERQSLEALRGLLETNTNRINEISAIIDVAKSRYEETVGDLRTETSALRELAASKVNKSEATAMEESLHSKIADTRKRIVEMEDAHIEELAGLRGQLIGLQNYVRMPPQHTGKLNTADEDVSDVPIVVAKTKAPITKTMEPPADTEESSEDDDDDDDDLDDCQTKPKARGKRRRISSGDSEYEISPRRGAFK